MREKLGVSNADSDPVVNQYREKFVKMAAGPHSSLILYSAYREQIINYYNA